MQRRGSSLARWLLRLVGWRLIVPVELPAQAVLVAYPHTSNWDFPLGIFAKSALGLDVRWVGKDSLFRGPLEPLMRWLGVIDYGRRGRYPAKQSPIALISKK